MKTVEIPKLKCFLTIRKASINDATYIMNCVQNDEKLQMSAYTKELDRTELEFWINDLRSIVLVGCISSKIIAYAIGFILSPKWFFFDTIFISPPYRKIGIGREMYYTLREILREQKIELIQGLVRDGENNSLKYWEKHEFDIGNKCFWVEDWIDD